MVKQYLRVILTLMSQHYNFFMIFFKHLSLMCKKINLLIRAKENIHRRTN